MRLPLFLLALLVSVSSWALNPHDRVDNFRLLDQTGTSHELYYFSDLKAVVLMTQTNDCDLVANSVPTVKALRDEYAEQGVQFFMINSNLGDDRASIIARAEELGLDIPVLMDPTQIIGESLGVERSGEIFVVDTSDWTVAYHGALGKKGKHLKAALTDVVAGQPVKVASTRAKGCAIDFPEQANRAQHANISYSDTIAPMLLDNCVACHRPGGIGPWEMTEYNMVRGFSLMMREVLRTGRMPPWHADPAYGHFSNDRSLTTDQKRTLVHWI
ncbi:MAG: redoxin family protein, partial [Pseudomonadales bacterium]